MKVVGLFRELGPGIAPSVTSIHEVIGALDHDITDMIGKYLDRGVPVFDVMEATVDPLDRSTRIVGGPSLLSDGEWVWRNDLSYFVRKYRVAVSDEFVRHAFKQMGIPLDRNIVLRDWQAALEAYELAEQGLL